MRAETIIIIATMLAVAAGVALMRFITEGRVFARLVPEFDLPFIFVLGGLLASLLWGVRPRR